MDERGNDELIVERVPARAALAGNPSDGYAGAVFAIPVDAYAATVTVQPAEHWSISDELSGQREFDGWDELAGAFGQVDADTPHVLVLATIPSFIENAGQRPPTCSIKVTTTIPLSVGLAGSSAIVVGVLRALYRAAARPLPRPFAVAGIALGVETGRLGITAGMQDRLVQSHGRPVLMRFDTPREFGAEPAPGEDRDTSQLAVPGADMRFLVAHRPNLSEPSQLVHGDLRRRFDAGDRTVRAAMSQLSAHAISARDAFVAGDAESLGASMDATYDLRARMIDLVPGHVEMVEAVRNAGASANYTGSGGAIVVLSPNDGVESAALRSLKSLGCEIVSVGAGPDAPWPA